MSSINGRGSNDDKYEIYANNENNLKLLNCSNFIYLDAACHVPT